MLRRIYTTKALKIAEMGYQSDAIVLWDELIQQLNASTAEADLELIVAALTNKGVAHKNTEPNGGSNCDMG